MKKLKLFIIVCLGIFILSSCQTIKYREFSDHKSQLIKEYSEQNNDVGVLVLQGKDSLYEKAAYGFKNKASIAMINNAYFEIGSASKIFTAIAILQLMEQGKLEMDTKVSKFYNTENIRKLSDFEGKNYWDEITIKMLLNHTSGFNDYLNAYGSDEKALEIFSDPNKTYSLEDIVNLTLVAGKALYKPNGEFHYSNTNYILLSGIIEKISGMPWRDYIKKNMFEKANLRNTFFGSQMNAEQKSKLLQGHYKNQPTQIPYTLAAGAGEIVSNLEDMAKFVKFWKNGQFFKNSKTLTYQVEEGANIMYKSLPDLKYTLGTMIYKDTFGHSGQTFGFQTYVSYNQKTEEILIISINDASVSSFKLFNKLLTD